MTPLESQQANIAAFMRGQNPSALARLFDPIKQVEHWGGEGGAGSVRNAAGGAMTLGAAAGARPAMQPPGMYENLTNQVAPGMEDPGVAGAGGSMYGSMADWTRFMGQRGLLKGLDAGGLTSGMATNASGITGPAHPVAGGASVAGTGAIIPPPPKPGVVAQSAANAIPRKTFSAFG